MDDEIKKYFIERLDGLEEGDTEQVHQEADAILLEALDLAEYRDIANAWRRARNRIRFWYA